LLFGNKRFTGHDYPWLFSPDYTQPAIYCVLRLYYNILHCKFIEYIYLYYLNLIFSDPP
jgi:hypothetical protein